jgi:transposase
MALTGRSGHQPADIPAEVAEHHRSAEGHFDGFCFSPHLYRARNRVGRFFNRIKQCRRVATRYDRLAVNYLAFVQLASIRLWLAARYESTP